MIRFDNWILTHDGEIIAQQFDHLTRSITITGDIPAGWSWELYVEAEGNLDIIPLEASVGALSVVLTKEQVSIPGYYTMQLRATQGDLVRHTNLLERIYIPRSLSGDAHWPELPTAFSQMEARVKADADRAAAASAHPHVIGENGNWWEWDGSAYVDTGLPSRGEDGRDGKDGTTGPAGRDGANGYTPVRGVDYWTPEDKQEMLSAGNTLYANALQGTASGTAIRLDDVSPLEHGVSVKVSRKNLWSLGAVGADFPGTYTGTGIDLYAPCPVTVSYTPSEDFAVSKDIWRCEVSFASGEKGYILDSSAVKASTFKGTPENPIVSVVFRGYNITAGTINDIQVELGSSATTYAPYVPDLTALPVRVCGSNLCDEAFVDGIIAGKEEPKYRRWVFDLPAGTYTYCFAQEVYMQGATVDTQIMIKTCATFTTPGGEQSMQFRMSVNDTSWDESNHLMVVPGIYTQDTMPAYEPYTGVELTPAEDGTINVPSTPVMTMWTDNEAGVLDCEYNRDINKAFAQLTQAILSLGGNI